MQDFRDWYTIPALARKWQDKGITEDDIEHLIETKKLKANIRIIKRAKDIGMLSKSGIDRTEQERANRLFPKRDVLGFGTDHFDSVEINIAVEEVARFEAEHFTQAPEITTGPAVPPPDLKPKDRNSLLTMVIAMAVKMYGYDAEAGRSTTPAEVAKDAAALGLSIDTKTVRKWLYEAAALLDKEKPL